MSYRWFLWAALMEAACASGASTTGGSPSTSGGTSGSNGVSSSGEAGMAGSGGSSGNSGSSEVDASAGGSSDARSAGSPSDDAASSGSGSSGSGSSSGSSGPPKGKYDWLQFEFSQDKMGIDTAETTVNASNVAMLTQLFQVALPDAPDGAPVALSAVATPMGVKDLVFVQGQHGLLTAFDGTTGTVVWKADFTSPNYGNSAPAIDPNRQYIYVNTSEGFIHKVHVTDGTEVKATPWPISTGKGGKASGQLAIGTDNTGISYLYATNNGQGRLTTVNLATGSTHVFNFACSQYPDTQNPPTCDQGANPWARSPVFLPDLQRVYVGTGTNAGSGQFTAGKIWRTSWVALPPDGRTTMMGGLGYPVDSYTVTNWSMIVGADIDTAVGGLIPIPSGYSSKYPHLALQPGKDQNVRLLNTADLSGQGGPGHLGGELAVAHIGLGLMRSWGTIWINPATKVAWFYVGMGLHGPGGIASFTIDLDATGNPTLTPHWINKNGWTTAPFIANGVLYATNNAGDTTNANKPHLIQALDPGTGNLLWSAMVGPHHWSSPIMVNGILYLGDGDSGGCDLATANPNCTPAGTNGHLTAWSLK
jgi:hypothetical protein